MNYEMKTQQETPIYAFVATSMYYDVNSYKG